MKFEDDFIDGSPKGKSVIAHFYEKLLKLKDNMNTKTGLKLAQERHEIMQTFLNQFTKEWNTHLE